jgi:hypothetical protein
MVFNATLNNIQLYRGSQFYWWRKTEALGENHRPVAYHIMLYRVHLARVGFDLKTLVVIDTDYTCSLNQTTKRDILKKQQESKIAI